MSTNDFKRKYSDSSDCEQKKNDKEHSKRRLKNSSRSRSRSKHCSRSRSRRSTSSNTKDSKAARRIQRQLDDIDRSLELATAPFQLFLLISSIENLCTSTTTTSSSNSSGSLALSSSHKLSLYHSTLRKAYDLFCVALVERILFFIQKFLLTQNIAEIDVVTFRYIDRVQQCVQLSERGNELLNIIHTNRSCTHTKALFPEGLLSSLPSLQDKTAQQQQGKQQLENFRKEEITLPNTKKLTLQEEIEAYIKAITGKINLSKEQAMERVKQILSSGKDKNEEVSLTCIGSGSRLKYPCVSIDCKHLQCFELRDFLQNVLSLRRRGRNAVWRCPVCRRALTENTILYDKLMEEILQQVSSSSEEFKGVSIYYDGSWIPLKALRNLPSSSSTSSFSLSVTKPVTTTPVTTTTNTTTETETETSLITNTTISTATTTISTTMVPSPVEATATANKNTE